MSTPAKSLTTIDKAAEYLDVSPKTVRRMIAEGDLVGYRLGSRIIRVDLNEVDAMLRPIPNAKSGGDAA